MTPKKHTFPTMHDDLTISFKQTPRKPLPCADRMFLPLLKRIEAVMRSKSPEEEHDRVELLCKNWRYNKLRRLVK